MASLQFIVTETGPGQKIRIKSFFFWPKRFCLNLNLDLLLHNLSVNVNSGKSLAFLPLRF